MDLRESENGVERKTHTTLPSGTIRRLSIATQRMGFGQ